MKKILLFVFIFSFFGCVTQKQRLKICNTCAVTSESKDSIVERVVHDTVKLPPIVGPTQYLENPCKDLCDSLGRLKPFVKKEIKNGLTSIVKSIGNSIVFECEADSLKAVIASIRKEFYHKKQESFVKYIPCDNERTKWDGFTYWWFWITLAYFVIVYGIKAIRTYFHI